MDDGDIKRKELKNKTSKIIVKDRRDDALESLIRNYPIEDDEYEYHQSEKKLKTKEEFFKEKEKEYDNYIN